MEWLIDNLKWIFSGVGVFLIGLLVKSRKMAPKDPPTPLTQAELKDSVRVLFVDDDTRFKVAKILQNSGWTHTKLIKDVQTLNDTELVDAHIVFVDVQGVGKALGFSEEGLGLAAAIKRHFPNKKVVIYSAETKGDRFHSALREADSFLAKNADPYEFQQLVEIFAEEFGDEGSL